jgi:hypothetical protein
MTWNTRARLYPTLLALSALAVFYGIASESEAALWVTAIMALVGNGVATAYTRSTDVD